MYFLRREKGSTMKKKHGFERSDRVSQQVHEVIARLFVTEVNDPRLKEVEIVDAEVAPDLRHARIYYTLRHGEEPPKGLDKVLQGVAGFLQAKLSGELHMKYTPELDFRFDESIQKGHRIDQLLSGLGDE